MGCTEGCQNRIHKLVCQDKLDPILRNPFVPAGNPKEGRGSHTGPKASFPPNRKSAALIISDSACPGFEQDFQHRFRMVWRYEECKYVHSSIWLVDS